MQELADTQEQKTLYAVNNGWYSDYRVHAIFDDKEMAEEYMRLFPESVYKNIEVYELNPIVPLTRQGYKSYQVRMARDGTVQGIEKDVGVPTNFVSIAAKRNTMVTDMMAKSEEHAIKIANERRAMKIATGQWPAP